MLAKLSEKLEHYDIVLTGKAMGEDGNYLNSQDSMIGYAVVNKETHIVEYTTTVLASAVFQADYLDKALTSLLSDEPEASDAMVTSDDVVLN